MSTVFSPVTGFPEFLENQPFFDLCAEAQKMASLWGCKPASLPLLEQKSLYLRNLGNESDIVNKEMFLVDDDFTLRPEGTSSMLRMWLNAGGPRYGRYVGSYIDTMYRREKPQANRYRQFTQFGVEVLSPNVSNLEEIEWLIKATAWIDSLQLIKPIELRINNIGNSNDRREYSTALVAYFETFRNMLDADDVQKLKNNPLRLLDSKKSTVRALLENAPRLSSYVNQDSILELETIVSLLNGRFKNIIVIQDPLLVRGLDYYSGLVYEWVLPDGPAQNAIGAGGRYDTLVRNFTNDQSSGFGFAFGLDRILRYMPAVEATKNVSGVWIVWNESTRYEAWKALLYLLNSGVSATMDPVGGKWGSQFQRASQNAEYALILGDQEVTQNMWSWKNMTLRTQYQSVAYSTEPLQKNS